MRPTAPAPFDLLQWLSDDARVAFGREARRRRCVSGEAIYVQGDDSGELYRILSGSIRLSVLRADGRELLYRRFEPGDCFGSSSSIDGRPRPHTAEAGAKTELQVIDPVTLRRLRAAHRSIDDALLRLTCLHMRVLSELFANTYLGDLRQRVAGQIVIAARSFGEPAGDGAASALRLTQAELALLVGSSRQSVNQVLRSFREQGLVDIAYGSLVVLDIAELRARAAGP
jgi:CRP-like cAMP-binding protein